RKGTPSQAKKAHEQISEIRKKFPKDPKVLCTSIRFHLRFATNQDDLLTIETLIETLSQLSPRIPAPYISMTRALWFCHPLHRDNQPEWFLLGHENLKKAFEEADTTDVQFLLDHLNFYKQLEPDKQSRCRMMIADLLGYTFN